MIREFAPSADLAPYVDAYWYSDGGEATTVIPDGCADIVLDGIEATVVGTMTRPIHVQSSAGTFGIRFRPGRAALALGASLTLVTDARVPLRDLTKRFGTIEPEIDSIEAALRSLFAEATPDRRVDAAVGLIARTGGRSSIDSVASEAGVSRQHLARAFAYHVGLTPKMFARVIRFRRTLALARKYPLGWADLASQLGYFDQSHLIAEFREFAGDTPVPFFLSRRE